MFGEEGGAIVADLGPSLGADKDAGSGSDRTEDYWCRAGADVAAMEVDRDPAGDGDRPGSGATQTGAQQAACAGAGP